jgi:FtsP/CotA-like multicopper oxidase with cupredoxin domain
MNTKSKEIIYHLEASEFSWEIAPGKTVAAWGFNQQLPGPSLKAKQGDTIVVKLKNSLSEPTIIHWHGVRLQASMDGTGEVQTPIQPGEEFEYRFTVPDAGTFWYHSHFNETIQMERGMYGSLIVEGDAEPVVDEERVLMIDDMKLDGADEFYKPGWFFTRLRERHDGREGNVPLINGKMNPTITVHEGPLERWRMINASSARYFLMHLGGWPFQIIATDGGLIEAAQTVTELLITPGERYDILVEDLKEGDRFTIDSLPYDRVTFHRPQKVAYATVEVLATKPSIASIPPTLRNIEPLAGQHAAITRKVKMSVGPSLKNGLEFMVNDDVHTVDAPVYVGELQVWEISNASLMDHPFISMDSSSRFWKRTERRRHTFPGKTPIT